MNGYGSGYGVFILGPRRGVRVVLTDLGATLMRIDVPDRAGRSGNILLGHDDPAAYPAAGAAGPDCYLGATCGRYANRIRGAAFVMDGKSVRLVPNEGANQLHGGAPGFHRARWQVIAADADAVTLRHHSPDGDAGWPGALTATARFSLDAEGVLRIAYHATSDRATHVNLVAHPYFNLSGDPGRPITDHRLRIAASRMLSIDAEALPLGTPAPVAGTPFDFTRARRVGEGIDAADPQIAAGDGYNHNYCLDGAGLRAVAWLDHPASGRALQIATDQPGLQFYSGNALPARRTGLCLETQGWPDAVNHPHFPSTRLDPGDVWESVTEYRFGLCEG